MKFLFFADFHHSVTGRSPFGGIDQLEVMLAAAEKNNVDFIIHGGDFVSKSDEATELMDKYNNFHIPTYHCIGNHDTDGTPYENVLKNYKMPDGHYYFDEGGYRIIVTDPNYSKIGDEYVHFNMGNYFKTPEARDWMPPEQIEWLKETIESAPHPCIIISHTSYERTVSALNNREDVQKVINDANKKRKNSVLMALNGHHHVDYVSIIDGVLYFDFNCVNNNWLTKKHDLFPKEITDKYPSAPHCVYWNDPLYAIITVEGTTITCEGTESDFFMGVTAEAVGCKYDKMHRPITPKVSSFKITL